METGNAHFSNTKNPSVFQNQQLELDLLLERVKEITKQADERNKQNIQRQSKEVTEEWSSLVTDLEKRRDALTKLAQVWENFEGRWHNFESLIAGIVEKSKHVDTIVRNKQQLIDTKQTFEVITVICACVLYDISFSYCRNSSRKQNRYRASRMSSIAYPEPYFCSCANPRVLRLVRYPRNSKISTNHTPG